MTPAPFTHHDEGTPESAWKSAFDDRMPSFAPLDAAFFETLDHLIVVAAHPDDETLGAAGLLARAGAAGARATVLRAELFECGIVDLREGSHTHDLPVPARPARASVAVARLTA